jgi:phosphoribosyl 1,2-cyclic phosphodiesterase
MFQTSVLASGSKGNCFLVKNKDTQILIDAGITFKNYQNCMTKLDLDPYKLDAIFISHEHSDHVGGAGVIHRKTNVPIYISQPTFTYSQKKIGNINTEPIFFDTGDYVQVKDLIVHPFASSHDAIDSCNFIVYPTDDDTKKLAIVTDCGFATNLLRNNLKKVTTIIIESNHDVQMLKTGPYEWYLKQRILSRTGHLSNEQTTDLIEEIFNDKIDRIVLAHLSEINNTPEIAYNHMKQMLDRLRAKVGLHISEQYSHTPLFLVGH